MAKDVSDLVTWLPSIPLFGGLEEKTLLRVIDMLGEHLFQPQQVVCKQGEPGRAMFVIRAGEVIVCRETEGNKLMKLIRMSAGEFFGEMTLIDIQKRSATVVVEKPSLLFSLSNRDLYTLFQQDVNGYVMVLQNLCRELSRRLRVTNQRLQTMAEDTDENTSNTLIRPALRKPI